MTRAELRNDPEFIRAKEKIVNMKPGSTMTIRFDIIPTPQRNAMQILLSDCRKEKLIDHTQFGVALNGDLVDTTIRRI